MTLLLPSHFHLHLTTFSLFFYSHTYSIRPQVCFSSDSFVCLLFFPCVCSLFTYHIHKLHTIVSDGLCTHKDPLPDTDYVLLLLYLNEIIATLALSSCSVVKKGKKKNNPRDIICPHTTLIKYTHSLIFTLPCCLCLFLSLSSDHLWPFYSHCTSNDERRERSGEGWRGGPIEREREA